MKMINQGQWRVLIFLSIILLTCLVRAGMTNAETLFEFRGLRWGIESSFCKVALTLTNRHSKTIEYISIDFTIHSKSGSKLGNGTSLFKYVDPLSQERVQISLSYAYCAIADYILIRNVTSCKIDGSFYSDCIEFISDSIIKLPMER